jgi:hypothetical protein
MVEEVVLPPPPFVVGEADEPLLASQNPAPRQRLLAVSGAVTSGIRNTLRYLRAEAGMFSMFRGLGYYIIYIFLESLLNGLFIGLLRPVFWDFADLFIPVFTALLLWSFNNSWLHKVISKPSQKTWFTRVGEQSRPRSVLGAIGLWAFCRNISEFVPSILASIFVLSKFKTVGDQIHFDDDASPKEVALEAFGICVLGLLLALLLVVPTTIVLVRVQASLLPETDEVIVPFDKTFGGKLAAESIGGGGRLVLLNAWRSFTWPARMHLLQIYAKYFALQITLGVYTIVVILVLAIAFGPSSTKDGVLALAGRVL